MKVEMDIFAFPLHSFFLFLNMTPLFKISYLFHNKRFFFCKNESVYNIII